MSSPYLFVRRTITPRGIKMETCKCAFCGKLLIVDTLTKAVVCNNKDCSTYIKAEGETFVTTPNGGF